MNKVLRISIILLLILSFLSIILYIANFNGGFSDDPNHWGAFGAFITPILTMLTMIILLLNLNRQNKEFKYQQQQKYILELNEYIPALFELYYPTRVYRDLSASGKPFKFTGVGEGEVNEFQPQRNDKIVKQAIDLDLKIQFINKTFISDKLLNAKIHLFKLIATPEIINFYSIDEFKQEEYKAYSFDFMNSLAANITDCISTTLSFGKEYSNDELEVCISEIENEIIERLKKYK
jgi:hypothetical protein